ncbi:MAG: hypothetical protein ACR2GH_16480 [Pseudonocardia sp.]
MPRSTPTRRVVEFVDTSILLEILGVPGKTQRQEEVLAELRDREDRRQDLILPTAAVIETGNHIHHLPDGTARRSCAQAFSTVLELSARGEAPWVLHDATWDGHILDRIRSGCSTGADLVEHATRGRSGLGTGDLSVLAERDLYREKRVDPRYVEVCVWCSDQLLSNYATASP